MRPSDGFAALARRLLSVVMLLIAPLGSPAPARADPHVTALVPAYFYPTWWAGSPWDDLNRAAAVIPIEAIMNPASGPGMAFNPDYAKAVHDLRAAGGKVIGYVSTRYGERPLADVVGDINAYLAWYQVDGIFLDEMGNQLGALDYLEVYGHIKDVSRDLHVVGNPGMPFLPVEAYLQAADTLVLFEGPLINADPFGASFAAYPTGGPYAGLPLWFGRYPRRRVANLVYGVPSAGEMRRALVKALRYNAGYVYLTNDVLSNPWDALPTYWADEVRAIAAVNTWLTQ
jgi:hypothetical protein